MLFFSKKMICVMILGVLIICDLLSIVRVWIDECKSFIFFSFRVPETIKSEIHSESV